MKIYVTRHGQVLPQNFYGDVQFPAGDPPLTEVGKEQAVCLGKYMAHLGFCGRIYSSPYRRTLETAEIIASYTGSEIIPYAPMREIMKTEKAAEEFCGMDKEEICLTFPHVAKDFELSYPWWERKQDSEEDVLKRVGCGFEKLELTEDAMFVGHGASAGHLINYLGIPSKPGKKFFNCCLSMLDTENIKKSIYKDFAHMPYRIRGANADMLEESERAYMQEFTEGETFSAERIRMHSGIKVLHIGDTSTVTYPYYKKMISEVKPDIIIHTGDVADEIKAGRMIGTREEYSDSVEKFAEILQNSGAKTIYVVPGNNDLVDVLSEKMPFAQIIKPNTQMDICGMLCTLAHAHYEVETKSQWHIYGHGLTGETHKKEENDPKGDCYFNVMWGSNLFLFPEREVITFHRPKID